MKIAPGTGTPVDADIPPLDTPEGRAEAERRSRGCRYCGGSGLAIVDAAEEGAGPTSCGATCVCLHGRWIRAWHMANDHRLLERIPDLARVMAGTDRRWTHDTGDYAEAVKSPSRDDINGMFRRPS